MARLLDGAGLWLFPVVPATILGLVALVPAADGRTLALSAGLLAIMQAASWVDARRMIIPDPAVAALGVLGVASTAEPDVLAVRMLAAIGCFLGLMAFSALFRRIRGRDGLGGGDIKFIAVSTLWIGPEGLPSLILFASLSGLLAAVVIFLRRRRLGRLPFAPHLAAALWLVWCCGPLVRTA